MLRGLEAALHFIEEHEADEPGAYSGNEVADTRRARAWLEEAKKKR